MTTQLVTPKVENPHLFKFTAKRFHLMYEKGIFTESERFELINGEIIAMSPIGTKHAACVNRLSKLFWEKLGNQVIVSVQNSILLDDKSQPQPDIAVLKYRDDFYEEALPVPEDILLIVEVADSSLEYDRDVKANLYAAVGIPEMWLFDVNAKIITAFSRPAELGYKQSCRYTQGDSFSILAFDDVVFKWQELF